MRKLLPVVLTGLLAVSFSQLAAAQSTTVQGSTGADASADVKSKPADTSTSTNWLTLDQTAGTDEFTIIFSTKPMTAPDFLNNAALHELTQDEQRQLDTIRQQNKANSAGAEVIKTGASPFVSVKVPQNAGGSPVIFMVRLEHK